MSLLKRIFKSLTIKNEKPGTMLGRYIVGLIPNYSVRMAVEAVDYTVADILANVFNDEDGTNVPIEDVKAAVKKNQEPLKALTLHLLAEGLEDVDIPYLTEEQEALVAKLILEQVQKNIDKAIDALVD